MFAAILRGSRAQPSAGPREIEIQRSRQAHARSSRDRLDREYAIGRRGVGRAKRRRRAPRARAASRDSAPRWPPKTRRSRNSCSRVSTTIPQSSAIANAQWKPWPQLFDFYVEHPEAMPRAYAELAQRSPRHRVVCDYIAGMTDHFLLRQHAELLGSRDSGAVRVGRGIAACRHT